MHDISLVLGVAPGTCITKSAKGFSSGLPGANIAIVFKPSASACLHGSAFDLLSGSLYPSL